MHVRDGSRDTEIERALGSDLVLWNSLCDQIKVSNPNSPMRFAKCITPIHEASQMSDKDAINRVLRGTKGAKKNLDYQIEASTALLVNTYRQADFTAVSKTCTSEGSKCDNQRHEFLLLMSHNQRILDEIIKLKSAQ